MLYAAFYLSVYLIIRKKANPMYTTKNNLIVFTPNPATHTERVGVNQLTPRPPLFRIYSESFPVRSAAENEGV
jgi:hypothetical protein